MSTYPQELADQVAVITGAAKGLGYVTALELARHGASLALSDINAEGLEASAVQLREETGRQVVTLAGDVRDMAHLDELCKLAMDTFGRLDIAIPNAGILRDNLFLRMTEDEWKSVLDVSLTGSFNLSKAAARYMRKQKSGRMVFMSSVSGIRGTEGQANYSAAKAGIIALGKTLARELAKYNIRVNVLCPGLIDTDVTRGYSDELRAEGIRRIPLGRFGKPEEVAGVIRFLVGPGGDYFTGSVIQMDGGLAI